MSSNRNDLTTTNDQENSGLDDVTRALEKLFLFQDKPLGKEKRGLLADALIESGIPTPALLLGINGLLHEDLNTLKLGTILAAARAHVEVTSTSQCDECQSGYVIMKDTDGRDFSLACVCGLGQEKARVQGLTTWNGTSIQTARGRMLTRA